MRKLKRTLLVFIILGFTIYGISKLTGNDQLYVPNGDLTDVTINDAKNTLETLLTEHDILKSSYIDYLDEHQNEFNYDLEPLTVDLSNYDMVDADLNRPKLLLNQNEMATYSVEVPQNGYYTLSLDYKIETATLNDVIVSITINDSISYSEMSSILLPIIWQDETKDYATDRYGDQVLSNQIVLTDWQNTALYSNTYNSVDPLVFYLTAGSNEIKIQNVTSTEFYVGSLSLYPPKQYLNYSEYIASYATSPVAELITIDAIDYVSKNSSYVQSYALSNASASPYNPVYKKLNVIDGSTWDLSGQALNYEFTVTQEGLYQLGFKYINDKSDFNVIRSIYVDGQIPFDEFKSYAFPTTKQTEFKNHTLSLQGNPYLVFLTVGNHTLSIKTEKEPLERSLNEIQMLIDHINAFALEIKKITGKTVDKDRTWTFTQYIPETPTYLEAYQTLLKSIITNLSFYAPNGYKSTTLSGLQKALYRIENIYKDYERLPFYLDDLIGGDGSVAQYLGNSLTSISEQPLYLDTIYLYNDESLPKASVGFFGNTWASIQTFVSSFTTDKFTIQNDPEVVEVWVNRPITYVDMMQKMADQYFTPETGVKVKITVMADPNKLIMSAAANQEPDVALGLASYMPYDLAIRNAAYDLSSFSDYYEFASSFSPGAFIPYILNEKAYAMPETLDFNVLMYRKDIFDSLGFMVPDTWDEVIQILPELQQYGMNFYHPIAGGGGTKYFYQTSGFIYQFGGSLYTGDGLKTAIDTNTAIQGLTYLNQLFTNYSLPEQVQSFYNSFRYATLPIGIADFNSYLLIKNAAPELAGKWDISLYPSITNDQGETNRYYIANGTAAMILGDTDKPNESWSFLKWWLGEETQTKFAFNIQSTYGPTYAWLSANIDAVLNSPLPDSDKSVILEQTKWLIDAPRTPGQYMLERSLSNIWNAVVFEGDSTGIAVDKYTILINREITKKMIEFGFISPSGEILKVYNIPTIEWIQNKMLEASGGYHGSGN